VIHQTFIMTVKSTRNILLILLVFLGLGALAGGLAMIISPSGNLLRMPLSLIEKSPFRSYLIPGIILFSVLGLAPCLLVLALIKKPMVTDRNADPSVRFLNPHLFYVSRHCYTICSLVASNQESIL
jgi:hypothetical protein